jgi:hypothetical protein
LTPLLAGVATFDSVTAQLGWYSLSANAVFLFVKLTNAAALPKTVSFVIATNIDYDGDDSARMASLSWNRGFRVWSSESEIRFICRSYPLVRNVSSFWIGDFRDLTENYWTQFADGRVSNLDASAAFSWRSISIPRGGFATRGVIVKFGRDEASLPILNLTFSMGSSGFSVSDPVQVTGRVTSFRYSEDIHLLSVTDNDLSTLQFMGLSFTGNSSVSFSFAQIDYGIWNADHQIGFYAVNSYGDVSIPETLMFSGFPIGESEGNSGDTGAVLGDPSISFSSSNDNGRAIIVAIASVTCVGLVVLIVVTLWIRARRNSNVQNDRPNALSSDSGFQDRSLDRQQNE